MAQWRAVLDLPGTPGAPRMGRELVAATVRGWGHPELVEVAELVVSELISNAIRHAPGLETYELELVNRPHGVRIHLADGSSIRPIVHQLEGARARGYGMRLVQALSEAWGAEDHHGGKRVWVDLGSWEPPAQ